MPLRGRKIGTVKTEILILLSVINKCESFTFKIKTWCRSAFNKRAVSEQFIIYEYHACDCLCCTVDELFTSWYLDNNLL